MIKKEVEDDLLRLAGNLSILLEDDFHDRALGPESISMEEEMENRSRFNRYTAENGLAWSYTVIEKDGSIVFTAPTVSPEEAQERARWYFYPYDDAPREFYNALASETLQYSTYRDQWGYFRTIIMPLRSPGGKLYASCIDLKINSYFHKILRFLFVETSLFIVIFILVLIYISYFNLQMEPGEITNRPVSFES